MQKPASTKLTQTSSTPSSVPQPQHAAMSSTAPPPQAPFIVRFYGEGAEDFKSRTLTDILDFSDRALERNHDYIQILFPASRHHFLSHIGPMLTDDVSAARGLRLQLRSPYHHASHSRCFHSKVGPAQSAVQSFPAHGGLLWFRRGSRRDQVQVLRQAFCRRIRCLVHIKRPQSPQNHSYHQVCVAWNLSCHVH